MIGVAYNAGFMLSLGASLRLNHESVVYSALVSTAVSFAAQVFFYLFPTLQGPVSLPWWSIFFPVIFGGAGVLGFAYLEETANKRETVNDESQALLIN